LTDVTAQRPETTPLSAAALRTGDSPISDLMARALACPDLISLAAGFVDHASLPNAITAEVAAAMLGDEVEGRRALQYGTTHGDLRLRRRLVDLIERQERVAPSTFAAAVDRVVITSGSQQLLYLVAEALIDPGDIVLVESPTYFVFLGVLRARGARVVGVETDEGGLRIDALEARLAEIEARGELGRVKLVYTVSEHSNPTGLSLEADRRGALVAVAKSWSRQHPIYVLEDAAYRGLTYEGDEPSSVWAHDRDGRTVILARTFSKTYSPGLKIGYGILPEALVGPVLALKGNHDFGSAHFAQQLLERVVAEGHYERQIARLRATYDRKRRAMLAALDEHFGPLGAHVSWTHPRGGLYVWLTLPEGVDTGRDGAFFARCLEEGVLYVPGAYAYADEPAPAPRNRARLTFGVTAEDGLHEGVRRLARALAAVWQPTRRARGMEVAATPV
jgi:2-aminoadipate transaminase